MSKASSFARFRKKGKKSNGKLHAQPSEKQPPENAENKPSTQPKIENDTKPIEEGPANNRGKIAMIDKSDSDANGQKGSTTTGIRSCN